MSVLDNFFKGQTKEAIEDIAQVLMPQVEQAINDALFNKLIPILQGQKIHLSGNTKIVSEKATDTEPAGTRIFFDINLESNSK